MTTLLTEWCNIYGAETGGIDKVLGGLGGRPDKQWYCRNRSIGRYCMECSHGHRGQVMPLCSDHFKQYRKSVSYCPRCNEDPDNGHKCQLTLEEIS